MSISTDPDAPEVSKEPSSEWETRYWDLLNGVPYGVVYHDATGAIISANAVAQRILGLTLDQLQGRTSMDPCWRSIHEDGSVFPGDTHPASVALRTGQAVNDVVMGVFNSDGGDLRWITISALPLFHSDEIRPHQVLVSIVDITDRKRAEASLHEAEWKFRALFEMGPIGVAYHRMIYDDSGKPVDYVFLDANQKYIDLTGVDPRGRTVLQAFPGIENDPFDWIGTFGRVARTGKSIHFEQHLQVNDRWYDCVGYQYEPDHFVAAFFEITERKRIENALREAHQFNASIIHSAQEGVIVYGPDLTYLVWNPFMEAVSGVSAKEVLGKHPLEVFPFLEKAGVMDRLRKILAGEEVGTLDFPYHVPQTGRSGWSSDRSAPLRNTQGEIIGVIGTVSDISEHKRNEEALRASEARYRSILNASPDAIVTSDLGGLVLGVPPLALKLFHAEHEDQLLGHLLTDFIAPEDRERAANRIGLMLQGVMTGPGEYRALRVDGTTFFMEANGEFVRDAEGHPTSIVFVLRDITAHRQAQDSLRESNELLSLFVHHSPVYAYLKEVTPTESRVLQASENFQAMIGIPGSKMVGKTMTELFPAELAAKMAADDWDVVSKGIALEFEEALNERNYITLKYPIRQGPRTLLAGFTIDITARKQAEEQQLHLQAQLQQAQKMESLGSLAGGVAHDMNNVLGAI